MSNSLFFSCSCYSRFFNINAFSISLSLAFLSSSFLTRAERSFSASRRFFRSYMASFSCSVRRLRSSSNLAYLLSTLIKVFLLISKSSGSSGNNPASSSTTWVFGMRRSSGISRLQINGNFYTHDSVSHFLCGQIAVQSMPATEKLGLPLTQSPYPRGSPSSHAILPTLLWYLSPTQ